MARPITARTNPYRVERLEALPFRQPGFCWQRFLTLLVSQNFRGAIVGNHGCGKTTLLAELARQLKSLGETPSSLRLNSESRSRNLMSLEHWLKDSAPEQILILDGAEQLGFFAWRGLLKRTIEHRGLLISQHCHGRLPTLLECRSSLQLFHELLQELNPVVAPNPALLNELYQKHGGNIRNCFRELYDRTHGTSI